MPRKKKIQLDKYPLVPRGAEHTVEADTPAVQTARSRDLRIDQAGREILSTEPVVLRIKKRLIGDPAEIRRQIQNLRATTLDGTEFETFEEADDFDLEDDYGDFTSKWEIPADHDDAVEAYKRYRATGELPAHLATELAKYAPAGTPPPPPSQTGSPPPAPAPQGPNNT